MITGVEFCFIVKDSLKAIDLYKSIFDVEILEATDLEVGTNEVVFSIYEARFHMLDANEEYEMYAPKEDVESTVWFNVIVPEIEACHQKALEAGCSQLQEVMDMEEMGIKNSMFKDPFGYIWQLNQITKEVDLETRIEFLTEDK